MNSRNNSYVKNSILYLRPTLTSDRLGELELENGTMDLWGSTPASQCTSPQFNGCYKQATPENILPPVQSARLQSSAAFSFKYGRVEIRAKLPSGKWLWPAMWMMPLRDRYGIWPASGEIDIMESRGNGPSYETTYQNSNLPLGNNRFSSCLHFGPAWNEDGFPFAVNESETLSRGRSYGDAFHTFG